MPVLLSKHDFIARLNAWAVARRAPAVSGRMLEDWNEEDIFPAAISVTIPGQSNPAWRYGACHYRRALIICRLKRLKINRYSEIRAALWLMGTADFVPVEDLVAEIDRMQRQIVAQISSSFDPGIEGFEGRNAHTLVKQMGAIATVLDIDGIKPSRSLLLDLYQAGRFGRPHQDLAPIIQQRVAELSDHSIFLEQVAIGPLTTVMTGFLSGADEGSNAGIELIREAKIDNLNKARDLVLVFVNNLGLAISFLQSQHFPAGINWGKLASPYLMVARAARFDPRWRITLLLSFLMLEKMGYGLPTPSAVPRFLSYKTIT